MKGTAVVAFAVVVLGAPARAEDVPWAATSAAEPRYRPGAVTLFVAAALSLGAGGYFAGQSDSARMKLVAALPKGGGPVSITQAQWTALSNQATSNGQLAAGLLAGAGVLAGIGAGVWWYGSRVGVGMVPGGIAVAGRFP